MKKRFGKDPGRRPSKEDIEREAAEELGRLSGRTGPPPASWGASPPAPAGEEPSEEEEPRRVGPSREERFRAELRRLRREPAPRPSKEDIEREAAEELGRLTGRTGPPPASWGASPSPAPSREEPSRPDHLRRMPPTPAPPGARWAGGPGDVEPDYDDDLTAEEEEELITEMALSDLAERSGRRPEDFAIAPVDPSQVAAARDRALQEILERQARLQRDSKVRRQPRPGGGSPLEQVADTFGAVPAGKAFTPLSVSMMPASGMATAGFAGSAQKRRVPRDSALRRSPPPEQAEPDRAKPAQSATRWAKAETPTAGRAKPAEATAAKASPRARPAKAGAPAATLAPASPGAGKAAAKVAPRKATRAPAAPAGSVKPATAKTANAPAGKATPAKPTGAESAAPAKPTAAESAAPGKPTAAKRSAAKTPAARKAAAKRTPR